jgi:hypothetical protein
MSLLRLSVVRLGLGMGALAGLGLGGCSENKPDEYARERPPVENLNSRDRGLQSAEVIEASDTLVQKILALPEVNRAQTRLTVVFTNLEDLTTTRQFNYDIFLERLKTNISEQGRDRIAIVSNRDAYYGTRSKELDIPRGERDDFKQGEGRGRGGPAVSRIQPDYALTGKVMELRNRGTSYYHFTFSLADIRADGGGTEIPMRYEVRVRK